MAELKKHPSLPSNYVTLGQLQERWIKEQQQKQKEIEEERERKEREKREAEENQKQREIRKRSETINKSVSIGRLPFLRNRSNPSEKNCRFGEVGKSVEAKIEEEQQRKERENEDQERKLEDGENQKRNEIRERSENINNSVSIDRRRFRRNIRKQSEKNRRTVEVGESKSVEAEIGAVIVVGEAINDQGEIIAELKKKKKKNWKKKNWEKKEKRRALENLIEGTTQLPPEKAPEGKERKSEKVALNGEGSENQREGKEIAVVVTRRKGEREGNGNGRGFRRNERNSTVNPKIWEQKTPVDPSVQTELKFEGLTLTGGTIGNEEPVMENNGGHLKYNSDYRRYYHRKEYRSVKMELKFEDLTLNDGTIGNEEPVMENNGGHLKYNSGYKRYNHRKEYGSDKTELKFEGLTLNGGTIGNEEPVMENNGGHLKYNSGYRRYNHRNEWKPPRDCNLAWVKKGEVSDVDPNGIQNSG